MTIDLNFLPCIDIVAAQAIEIIIVKRNDPLILCSQSGLIFIWSQNARIHVFYRLSNDGDQKLELQGFISNQPENKCLHACSGRWSSDKIIRRHLTNVERTTLQNYVDSVKKLWRYDMETPSALLTLCEGIHWWRRVPSKRYNNSELCCWFDVNRNKLNK